MSHWIASVISSSPARRRLDRAHRVVDRAVEQVDADEREVGRRIGRLLDQAHDLAVGVDLGHAELARVVDVGEQDLRGGRPPALAQLGRARRAAASNAVDELAEALLEHVVAEVHDEVVVAEEVAGDEHAVRQAERRVLRDVGDLDARTASRRRPRPGSRRRCRRR